jgi:hypothetical protein
VGRGHRRRTLAAGGDRGTSAGLRARAQIQRGLRVERSSPMDGLESTPNRIARTDNTANGPTNSTVATITLSSSMIVTPSWLTAPCTSGINWQSVDCPNGHDQ